MKSFMKPSLWIVVLATLFVAPVLALGLAGWAVVIAHSTVGIPPFRGLTAPPEPGRQTATEAHETYGRLPQSFEPNRGQTNAQVSFLSRGHGYSLFLTPKEAVLALNKPAPQDDDEQPAATHALLKTRRIHRELREGRRQDVLRMRLLRSNAAPAVEGFGELSGKSNYFIGGEPYKWLTNVPTFAGVRYYKVYPGVDLIYRGDQGRLEFDFIVSPGADPGAIALSFDGTDRAEIDGQGDLVMQLGGGQVRHQKPSAYQEVGGVRLAVPARFVLQGRGKVGFEVGEFDRALPLVIDPVLTYSTYLGGAGADIGIGIAVDDAGSAYVTGATVSLNFPTRNPMQRSLAGTRSDVFVSKLNASGTALVYSTYVGGSVGDIGHGIDVDAEGNAYVCGTTGGSISFNNFPTVNALDPIYGGTDDAFLLKLNPTGSALVYSTYLGGANSDIAYGVAVDRASGEAYLSGITLSADFPVTPGALKTSLAPGDPSDAFVTKFNAQGSSLAYSTLLGGPYGSQAAYGIALDSAGIAYITGESTSSFFPVTPGAFQTTCTGCEFFRSDAFLAKLNPQGTGLIYSSYLGGSQEDYGFGIAVDASGDAYVVGQTESGSSSSKPFPTTPGSFQRTGDVDAFVTKFSADGSGLVYSTYLGGSVTEEAKSVAVDSAGNAAVTGKTNSPDFPLANPLQPAIPALGFDNVFISTLNPSGSALVFSTFFGSGEGRHVVTDGAGSIYVTGLTYGSLPTASPLQGSPAGSGDAFVTKLVGTGVLSPPPLAPTGLTASAVSSSRIDLNWSDNSDNEGGFKVERCLGAGCVNFVQVAQVGANSTSYSDTGLASSTTCSYRVRAFNGGTNSDYSNAAEVTTPPAPPTPASPTDLTANAVSKSQIDLAWADNSNNEDGFRVERCTGSACTGFAQVAQVGANVKAYSDILLSRNTTYRYRVRAFNAAGVSGYSNIATDRTLHK